MRFIKSKLIQKAKGRKRAKYHLTIEVTDHDIEMFEEFGGYPTASTVHGDPDEEYKKMNKYLFNLFYKIFHKLWRKHD